jgi:hypothetical protein
MFFVVVVGEVYVVGLAFVVGFMLATVARESE